MEIFSLFLTGSNHCPKRGDERLVNKNKIGYTLPAYLLFLMNVFGFGLLCMANDFKKDILFVGLGLLGLLIVTYTVLVLCRMGDKFLFLIASMLVTMGTVMLCRINIEFGAKQILWIGLGAFVFFFAYIVYYKIKFWDKLWLLYALFSTALFLGTLIFGQRVNGSKNWIEFAGFGFQPSEIIKIAYVMFLGCYYSGSRTKDLFNIHPRYVTAFFTYLFIIFLVLQRDWGTILVLFSIYIFILYVYEDNRRFVLFNIGSATIVALLGYMFLHHIQVRVNVWRDPWSDISNTGYQIAQSLFAIASGGYFGKGIGNGSPSYIPEVHTDFIYSAICEEMGVFGGAAIIILFFLLAYRCFKITIKAKNAYNKSVALGITLMFALQTFIIIGGVTKFIPLTGITVPFVSYGGSSIVVSFLSLGIIQAISAKEDRGTDYE